MVDISVIIVSYNVKFFLEQAIIAVLKSTGGLTIEIIVVDNNSSDGSIEYLKSRVSGQIKYISNTENVGFASANNQGIKMAIGYHVLLLNPDTVIQTDTLIKCLKFSRENPSVGAIGVKMVDGNGKFLPESKRSIPTPINSFWKLTGVSSLFPKSKIFSKYNLGHVGEEKDAEVEVLCGAFIFMPTKVVKEVGLLDEDYFMFGEDIDLSYKIKKAGYKIWYQGSSSIIHYKGQSTKKSSIAYVQTFYKAMTIFVKKHYGAGRFMLFIISIAITLRQLGSLLNRVFSKLSLMLLDAIFFTIGFFFIKNAWAKYQFEDLNYYEDSQITLNIFLYVSICILALWVSRSYQQYWNKKVFLVAITIGLFLNLIVYSLLPLPYRSSRAIILLGTLWVFIIGFILRAIFASVNKDQSNLIKRIGIVGKEEEAERTRKIIHQSLGEDIATFQFNPEGLAVEELVARKEFNRLNEIVFCLKDISLDKVLKILSHNIKGLNYKLIGDQSLSIIGSRKSNEIGEVYGLDISYKIESDHAQYYKRCLDIFFSISMLLIYPILYLSKNFRCNFKLSKLIKVLLGRLTMVSYNERDLKMERLPKLKQGILQINKSFDIGLVHKANTSYALNYTPWRDVVILFDTIF